MKGAVAQAAALQSRRKGGASVWKITQYVMALCALLLFVRALSPAPSVTSITVTETVGTVGRAEDDRGPVIDVAAEQAAAATPMALAEPGEDVDFKIFVLGYKRYKSLARLLKSLTEADYFGDRVALHINIDGGSGGDWQKSIDVANQFEWKFGPKHVKVAERNGGLAKSWLTCWYPKSDDERAIILEDDLAVSPVYYRWLKIMYKKYDDRPEIAGYTLQRQRLVASSGGRRTVQSIQKPFAYKLLGSWGFAPSAKHWREFVKLDFRTLNPAVPGLITTKWYRRQRNTGKMWTQFWIWYCDTNNLYNIYITPPNKKAMASNFRERGVHYGSTRGADFRPLSREEWVPEWDSPPDVLDLYSWSLSKEGKSIPPGWKTTHPDKPLPTGDEGDDDESESDKSSSSELAETDAGAPAKAPATGEAAGEAADDEISEEDMQGLAEPLSVEEVAEVGSEMDTSELVIQAQSVQKEGIMFLQLLNDGFVEMTKSWICNVQHMERVLDRTLFVCTDRPAYDKLLTFSKASGLELNLHLQARETPRALRYGQLSYYKFILYRASLLEALLRNGVSVFLVESDATWFGDPVKYFLEELDPSLDVVLMHNDYNGGHGINGGFIWFKARDLVLEAVRKLYVVFSRRLKDLDAKGEEKVGGKGNEQGMIRHLLFDPKANPNAAKIKSHMLPVDRFAGGLWFGKNHRGDGFNPLVVLNNWVRGNDAKKKRAQQWGQWFLDASGETCADRIQETPYLADTSLAAQWDLNPLVKLADRVARESEALGDVVFLQFIDEDTVELTASFICNMRKMPAVMKNFVFVAMGSHVHEGIERYAADLDDLKVHIFQVPKVPSNKETFLKQGIIYKILREKISVVHVRPNVMFFEDPVEFLAGSIEAEADAALPERSSATLHSNMLAFYRGSPRTIDYFERYVAGTFKNLVTAQTSSPVDKSVPLSKGFRTSEFALASLKKTTASKPAKPAGNVPWARWWIGGSAPEAKVSQAKAVKTWSLDSGLKCS